MILLSEKRINFFQALLITVIGLMVIGFGIYLAARLFNIDLEPYILKTAEIISGGRLVNLETAFEASENVRVCEVHRQDTDGDDFKEWVVYFQTDAVKSSDWRQPCPDNAPRAVTIYDNDRGSPPIVFPYTLLPANGDFLGEEGIKIELHEIDANPGSETRNAIPELFIFGRRGKVYNQLTIFKHQTTTRPWESPTNEVPRYQLIGSFNGSGGVKFDEETKEVTVLDRNAFERSQLAVKNVYRLHGESGQKSYLSQVGTASLPAPKESTIDFGVNPPEDIFLTPYAEKIVLGFYQSLAANYERNWDAKEFLTGDALNEYNNGNLPYFGFPITDKTISNLAVTQLQYFPEIEIAAAESTIEGAEPQFSRVETRFAATQKDQQFSSELLTYEMVLQTGKWKISRRIQQ